MCRPPTSTSCKTQIVSLSSASPETCGKLPPTPQIPAPPRPPREGSISLRSDDSLIQLGRASHRALRPLEKRSRQIRSGRWNSNQHASPPNRLALCSQPHPLTESKPRTTVAL